MENGRGCGGGGGGYDEVDRKAKFDSKDFLRVLLAKEKRIKNRLDLKKRGGGV